MQRVKAAALLLAVGALLSGADWPRFRGATGAGATDETGLPTRWSDTEGVAWKAELPGPGTSSPIVSGGRVFVTAYSGYGLSPRDPGDATKLKRHVVSVDAASGKILWDRALDSKQPEEPFRGIGMPNHGYASSTPAADGERVYAFFGRTGVVAFDYEGKEAWRAEVAPDPRTNGFGTASSLLVVKDLVIVPASVECEAIVAFDRKTGKEAWRSPAAGYGGWWSTPILVEPPGGRPEIVVSVPGELWGLNPENGKLRWHSEASPDRNSCPSPVAAGGIVYAVNGRQSPGAVAVRLGGRGDVTKTHVAWNVRAGSYLGSPVVHEGHLYWVNDQGVAHCYRADTGAEVYRQRLEDAGGVYASAVLAEGKLYVVTKRNGTFILDARPEFRQLAVNKLAADTSDFNASPAVSGGKVYLRSNRYLYAIGPAAK